MARYVPFIGKNTIISFKDNNGAGADVVQDPSAGPSQGRPGKMRFAGYLIMDAGVAADKNCLVKLKFPMPWPGDLDPLNPGLAPPQFTPMINFTILTPGITDERLLKVVASPPLRLPAEAPAEAHTNVLFSYGGVFTDEITIQFEIDFGHSSVN